MIQKLDNVFRVYGDNILECELFLEWLNDSRSNFEFVCEIGPIDRPIIVYRDMDTGQLCGFHLTPSYGVINKPIWPNSPLSGRFNEKPDVLVVRVLEDYSESDPLFVIEFDDALQAGNQSWQRSRRAVDASRAGIPYFYVVPLIGWEKTSDGASLKNPRFQNGMIATGHLALLCNKRTISLQIYKKSPWTDLASKTGHTLPSNYWNFNGISNAIIIAAYLLRQSVTSDALAPREELNAIIREMLSVARTYSNFAKTVLPIHCNHPALEVENEATVSYSLTQLVFSNSRIADWIRLDNIRASDFFRYGAAFCKTVQPKTTTNEFRNMLQKINWPKTSDVNKNMWLRRWGVEIDMSEGTENTIRRNAHLIPVTYKKNKTEAAVIGNRAALRNIIKERYSSIGCKVLDWIYRSKTQYTEPIIFIPLYGYKPTGDSRPDRGLIPHLYANFPRLMSRENTMVVMYSIHTPNAWKSVLMDNSNQLWSGIKEYCGLVIVDRTGEAEIL